MRIFFRNLKLRLAYFVPLQRDNNLMLVAEGMR